MIRYFKLYLIGIGLLLSSTLSLAKASDNAAEMPKDMWLELVKKAVSEPVCKSFIEDESIAAQMTARNISYESCVLLVPGVAENCEKKYYNSLPNTINDNNAEKWGQVIGECIGNDFSVNYLSSDPSTTDTTKPAKGEI